MSVRAPLDEAVDVRDLVPEWILRLAAYPPGMPLEELEREYGISGSIKLASNENPFGPSPRAVAALSDAIGVCTAIPTGAGSICVARSPSGSVSRPTRSSSATARTTSSSSRRGRSCGPASTR